jgi:hypothetical protein
VLRVSEGTTSIQAMTAFTAGRWSGGQQLYWRGGRPGARLELALPTATEAMHDLEIVLTKARDYGIAQLWLDDAKLGRPVDLYHPSAVVTTGVLTHKSVPLTAGQHVLGIEIVGANRAAVKEYMFGLDYVRIVPSQTNARKAK